MSDSKVALSPSIAWEAGAMMGSEDLMEIAHFKMVYFIYV